MKEVTDPRDKLGSMSKLLDLEHDIEDYLGQVMFGREETQMEMDSNGLQAKVEGRVVGDQDPDLALMFVDDFQFEVGEEEVDDGGEPDLVLMFQDDFQSNVAEGRLKIEAVIVE